MSATSTANGQRALNLRLVTAVWGDAFVDVYLRIALRSLLSDGNLIDLARSHSVQYSIYTTKKDAERLEKAEIFRRVREAVDVRFSYMTTGELEQDPSGHVSAWSRGLELARRNGEILFFIIPDNLFGEGTLTRWASRFRDGFGAVYTASPYVTLETLLPELEASLPEQPCTAITLDGRKVRELVARHLHPVAAAMVRGGPRQTTHPEHDIRPVDRQGFVIRPFASQPLCIDPSRYVSIKCFNPESHAESICVEPCTTASLEPLLNVGKLTFRPSRLDGIRISQLGDWWNTYGVFGCREESRHVYEFCLSDEAAWREARKRAVIGSRALRLQIQTAAKYFRIWNCLVSNGQHLSASLLAAAIFFADLRRKLCLRQGAVILVPMDSAFDGAGTGLYRELLALGRERDLISWIKGHIILPSGVPSNNAGWHTANGVSIDEFPAGVRMLCGPVMVDEFTVYFIDRILPPFSSDAGGSKGIHCLGNEHGSADPLLVVAAGACEMMPPMNAATTPKLDRAGGETLRPAKRAARVSVRTALYCALIGLHRGVVLCSVLLPLGKAKHITRRAVEIVQTEGWRSLAMRIRPHSGLVAKIYHVNHITRRAIEIVRTKGRHGLTVRIRLLSGLVAKSYRTLRPDVGLAAPPLDPPIRLERFGPSIDSLALFKEIRLVRTLQAIAGVLGHYEQVALPEGVSSFPLRFIRDRLKILAGDEGSLELLLERALTGLLHEEPHWAECWAEMGFLKCDQGQDEEALKCFDRIGGAKRASEIRKGSADPLAWAYAEAGRLLAKRGHLDEAVRAVETIATLHTQSPSWVHDTEAAILRQLGWPPTENYFQSKIMIFDAAVYPVPFSGRDASTLSFSRLAHFSLSQPILPPIEQAELQASAI